jgi:hypothetical protein
MPCRLRSEIILGKAAGKIASAKGFGLSSVLISAMILRKQPQSHYSIRNELKKSVVSLATSVPKVDPTMARGLKLKVAAFGMSVLVGLGFFLTVLWLIGYQSGDQPNR